MDRPRLAVLDASHGHRDTRRNVRRELDADLAEFDVTGGDVPPSFAYDGVLVTGSRASVYWEEPWIEATRRWTSEAIERDLPCLGICWGHQLLADAMGGTVEPMDGYELGYKRIRRQGPAVVLSNLEETFTAFATHADEVTELPAAATVTAETDRSIHGFRAGTVFGVQFHPEYDEATARSVTDDKRGEADPERIDRALASIDDEHVAAAAETKRLFDAFLGVVERRRARPASSADAA